MPGAMARRGKRKRQPDGEDAFVDAMYRFLGWVQQNQRAVIAGGVALVLLAGGLAYYVTYRSNLTEQAAVELQEIRATLSGAMGADAQALGEAVGRLGTFVDRYEGTPAAREGRVLLGRIQLRNGSPEQAIETLRPAAELPVDHPLGYAANSMLATAYVDADRQDEALSTLERLEEESRFAFQRREAADRRAQLLIEAGDLEAARAIYSRLVEEAPETTNQESYALKLGEVKAMMESSAGSAGRSESAEPSSG